MTNLRDKYIEELVKEVMGPRNGPEEIIVGADPYTEYVTGVIIPQKCKKGEKNPDSEILVPESADSDEDNSDTETSPELPNELDPRMKPKSFGISFLIKGDNPVLKVCITWGRYIREIVAPKKSDSEDADESKVSWKRQPFRKIINISLSNDSIKTEIIYNEKDGKIILNIRRITLADKEHVILSLINDLNIEECSGDKIVEAAVYQPSLRVILSKGCHLESIESIKNDKLDFIYREKPVLARGHMCSAIWKEIDYQNLFETRIMWPDGNHFSDCQEFINCDVRTEFVSLYPSPTPIFTWDNSESIAEPEFSAHKLSEMWGNDMIDSYLSPLTKGYEKWIIDNEKSQNSFSDKERELVIKLIQHQRMSLQRLNSGIQYIKDNEDALLSFCFANKVIWLQNLWKKREKYNYSKEDFRWRPFQLAFFLINLESLSSSNSKYRNYLDLLWIPTGGGKTEAYLAMMAYVISLRRRNAKNHLSDKDIDRTGAGTAIITRYTLRLLTVQQFRRTLIMITAAEYLRVFNKGRLIGWRPEKCQILDNWLYGSVRFSVGMWVGGSVSPNHLRGDHSAIKALEEGVSEGEPAQIIKCPVCGAWLAVPRAGLSEGANPFYMTVKSTFSVDDLKRASSSIQYPDFIKDIDFIDWGHLPNHLTLSLKLESNRKIDERELDDQISKIVKALGVEGVSFRPSRPGYFPSYPEPGRRSDTPVDFEIFCPNPECDLNNGVNHKEGVPLNLPGSKGEQLSDGLFIKENLIAFLPSSRIPIPAYTVDEQIYHRCPTVIVSTADKIARLAFEPRSASIFGNITNYNAIYGYYRENLLPKNSTITASSGQYSVNVRSFHPPEMIVQDELHLMDGPLGSMFGLYECIVDGLIHESGGNPKYIASSATVNKAENQVESLFKRPLFQFPAYGLTFKDSFFVRMPDWSTGWDESRPGRIYMGIYAPGRGPLTPIIRLWSRILNTGEENRSEKDIINFWTLVGYFNSLRELGGNRALYREDIIERLSNISKISPRNLDAERVVELSSRIDSTDIPQILEELEQGQSRLINENPDAIFTTSMFGTGVDIPHLSLMVVNGQPKTTSQYIQATGRVGRSHGALVITFYKAGRPRDLSHYEIFTGYHHRINLEVEPASVSPFSDGCMAKAAGPGIVSFLRNMHKSKVMWFNESGHNIGNSMARNDFEEFINYCLNNRGVNDADVINKFQSQFDRWLQISQLLGINQNLVYNEYTPYRTAEKNVVLGDPAHERVPGLKTVYKNAPQSLRDIEETTAFEV
ncbi:MAG: DISARM system helicase DrmA [Candidatus Methanoperedens sp.]|nr:DISARM system helicase DrmA [Candidatus Methanoperedens sp.]